MDGDDEENSDNEYENIPELGDENDDADDSSDIEYDDEDEYV